MGDDYTFIDCPGSVEFANDMRAALPTEATLCDLLLAEELKVGFVGAPPRSAVIAPDQP